MEKATKAKAREEVKITATPAPDTSAAINDLALLITDLEAKIGDGGTVEERQGVIDRLKAVLGSLK